MNLFSCSDFSFLIFSKIVGKNKWIFPPVESLTSSFGVLESLSLFQKKQPVLELCSNFRFYVYDPSSAVIFEGTSPRKASPIRCYKEEEEEEVEARRLSPNHRIWDIVEIEGNLTLSEFLLEVGGERKVRRVLFGGKDLDCSLEERKEMDLLEICVELEGEWVYSLPWVMLEVFIEKDGSLFFTRPIKYIPSETFKAAKKESK